MAKNNPSIAAEFLIEPFVEGNPGPHVDAALSAFADAGLDVDLGPFSSSTEGDVDAVATAVANMIRASMTSGATEITIQIGTDSGNLGGLDGVPSLQNALDALVKAAERDTETPAADWDRAQKQAVVRMLDERGAFLLRGAVDDIAEIMGVSRITIYNYLNAIES